MPSGPFVDRDTRELDLEQIFAEAVPLLGLIVLFGALALVPALLAMLFPGASVLTFGLLLVTQLILAVGLGVILLYVVARGNQLASAE
ncbi:hypothetical protein [Halovenus marina]|uniref:hypothetical protein n=1 Tax=Halovenus marina TaxID=3396621 RepID=UPI003F575730